MAGALGELALSSGTLDRMAARRDDEDWIAARWADERTRVLLVSDDGITGPWSGSHRTSRALVRLPESHSATLRAGPRGNHWRRAVDDRMGEPAEAERGSAGLVFVSPGEAPEGERYFLGVDEDVAYFAVAGALPETDGSAEPAGLREVGTMLDAREAGLLAYAVALRNWHARNGHCPRCGARTEIASAGHIRVCADDGSQHFPRVDPAVIMLVRDQEDRILLARGAQWPAGGMSILAGFVEPGESMEQAVIREVHEEVGLRVRDCVYLASQPWPLPQSLMIGYSAVADSGEDLRLEPAEIAEARWFTRDELRKAVDAGDVMLSPHVSIARRIIESWYGSG